jgi:hypothetical protein
MTYQLAGNAGIQRPGIVVIVLMIQARISSRPVNVPYACSSYVASSVKRSANRPQSPVLAAISTSAP